MELVERDEALESLRDAVAQAVQGRGRTLLVHGEAGIGKSSLLKAALREPNRASASRLLWGGCDALFSPRPLGPLYDMARELGPRVRTLLGQDGQRSELFGCLLDELRDAARPSVMVFEDVHWADEATLDLLKYLGRRIEGTAALLVLSYRDDEIGDRHPLRSVLGDLPPGSVHRIALPALTESGVQELARRAGTDRAGLHAATRGNPFYVTECLRGDGIPATVRDAVLTRVSRLGDGVRALLDLAAIVPSQVETRLVDAILAPGADVVAAALSSGLLVADATHFAFRHELARRAIEGALAAPAAANLHASVLVQLEAWGGDGGTLAQMVHHAKGAGESGAVLRHAPRAAAWAALHGAHREAAILYGVALEHAQGLDGFERADLLQRHAYQCYLVAEMKAAVQSRQAALAIWRKAGDREREGHNLRWLSRLHWFLGQNAEAEHHADAAIAILQALPPGRELAWALSNRAQLHMLATQTTAAVELGLRAVALGAAVGDVEVQAHALNNVGSAQYLDGEPEGRARLEDSLKLSLQHGYSEHVARACVNLVSNALGLRDYGYARRYVAEATSYFAARDLNAWVDYLAALACRLDLETGLWASAANTAAQLVGQRSVMPISRLPALIVLARLRMRRGDPGVAEALLEATTLAQATGELQRLAPVAVAHAEAAWLQHPSADLGFVRHVLQQAIANGNARYVGELAFWLDPDGATFADPGLPLEPPYAAQRDGQWDRAAALWAELGCPLEQALALVAGGGEDGIRVGLAGLDALGATATAQQCRSVLRLRGVKGVVRGPRATTAAHPGGLTVREAQVLALMAQGLTNAEIAARIVRSAKTVDHHISAILGKLQARSRAEATAIAARLGLLDGEKHRQSSTPSPGA